MSEADRTWRVTVDDQAHEIEIDHNTMTGKIVVKLDGDQIGEERMLAKSKQVEFAVGSATGLVEVTFAFAGFGAKSELHVNGAYVEPLAR